MAPPARDRALGASFAKAREALVNGASAGGTMAAIRAIDELAAEGHAGAMSMVALFHAMGAMRPQSWPEAMKTLGRAADLGDDLARRQLALLGTNAVGGDPLQAPPLHKLSDTPQVMDVKAFASPQECAWLIARARPRLAPAAIWDDDGARVDVQRSNSAISVSIADMDVVTELLRARIARALRLPVTIFEPPQILHYAVGQEFAPHFDFLDPQHPSQAAAIEQSGQRMGTFLIYLNDDFDGGETEFLRTGLAYRGSTGDGLFWGNLTRDGRPDPLTLHAGRPTTRGEKWVMSTWIRDRGPA